jgi:hypothetical protein
MGACIKTHPAPLVFLSTIPKAHCRRCLMPQPSEFPEGESRWFPASGSLPVVSLAE